MDINNIISLASLIGSLVAIYFASRKQNSEVDNIDADTISTLYDTISKQDKFYKECQKEQEARYKELKTEFESYKEAMSIQMSYLQSEATKWRNWAEKLNKQLKDNGIVPEKF